MKTCSCCGEVKDDECFRQGRCHCRECRNEAQTIFYCVLVYGFEASNCFYGGDGRQFQGLEKEIYSDSKIYR